ncbi:HPr family phosphocarrier protein [Paenibacillus sp. FSL K6-2862]|uniref:HPr family phosphocarrier protein n=1 Tax=Paenibacillus sp. FSL K6-2862 TaxID=2921484 RepID=UPI0030F5503F
MTSIEVTVQQSGFPLLFAKQFTETAAAFIEEEIRVIWPTKNIISDAKSILGVMALEVITGTTLTITAQGPKEQVAAEKLAELIRQNQ